MMTDPIADMLTRIRNAGSAGHKWVDMPVSKLKARVADLLKDNHFIYDFKLFGGRPIRGASCVSEVSRMRGPSSGTWSGYPVRGGDGTWPSARFREFRNGLGMAILSTSQGLMSDRVARKQGVGGELMALVW